MKLSRAFLIAISTFKVRGAMGVNATYYPDWEGGTNTCLNDGNNPYYMEKGSYLKTTLEECCDYYYAWNPSCIKDGGGTPPAGSSKWYVNYGSQKCVQDCAAAQGTACGGLATPWDTLYADEAACCAAKLSSISPGLCQANSLANGTYAGTNKWYVDYQKNKCVKDCATSTTGCGGIIEDSATSLYSTAAACCAAKLSYINAGVCETTSSGGTISGSSKWYVDYQNQKCVKDCPVGGTACGGLADSWVTLYADAAACCAAKFSYVPSGICQAKSSATGAYNGTGKFYVDYQNNKCVQDCATPTAGCGGIIADTSTALYADAAACCAAKLSYVDADVCKSNSNSTSTGTGKYYADSQNKKCLKDSNPPNGVRAPASAVLYDTVAKCCSGSLSWVNSAYCVSRSDGTGYSSKWYVDYQNEICKQDCASGATCAAISDVSTPLFDSALACCQAKLGWIDSAKCNTLSTGGTLASTGSEEYYVDWSVSKCVKNCVGAAPCGGLAEKWEQKYATSALCCARLSWIPAASCVLN